MPNWPRVLWSLHLLTMLALGIGRTVEKILRDSGGPPSRYGPALGAIIIAIGVAGYVWRRPIGWAWLWRIVFGAAMLAGAGLVALEVILLTVDDAPARIHALILGGFAMLLPAQVALYRYAFRMPDLWEPPDSNAPKTTNLSRG